MTDESAKAKLLAWANAAVLEGSDATYLYCFCLTDIYGEIQLSDFINFEL